MRADDLLIIHKVYSPEVSISTDVLGCYSLARFLAKRERTMGSWGGRSEWGSVRITLSF